MSSYYDPPPDDQPAEVLPEPDELDAAYAEIDRLRAVCNSLRARRNGLYGVFRALAEDDRPMLAAVDERIQADVDIVIAERIDLRAKLAAAEERAEQEKSESQRLLKECERLNAAERCARGLVVVVDGKIY